MFQDVSSNFRPNSEVLSLRWVRQPDLFLTPIQSYIRHFRKINFKIIIRLTSYKDKPNHYGRATR
jgi:hypothetical protein